MSISTAVRQSHPADLTQFYVLLNERSKTNLKLVLIGPYWSIFSQNLSNTEATSLEAGALEAALNTSEAPDCQRDTIVRATTSEYGT